MSIQISQQGQTDSESNEHSFQTVRTVLLNAARQHALEAAFPLTREPIPVTLTLPHGRQQEVQLAVSPEYLTAVLLSRSELSWDERAVLSGTSRLEIPSGALHFQLEFHDNYAPNGNPRGKHLVLREFSKNSSSLHPLWQLSPGQHLERFLISLESEPGLFVFACPNDKDADYFCTAIAERFPAILITSGIEELAAVPNCLARLKQEQIIVRLPVAGVLPALQLLKQAPLPLRQRVAHVCAFTRVARLCPFCALPCRPHPQSVALLPVQLRRQQEAHWYPSGCTVCSGKGYLGRFGVLAANSPNRTLAPLFLQEYRLQELQPLLQQAGFESLFQQALQAGIAGTTTIEAAAAHFNPNKEQELLARAYAAGREDARSHKEISAVRWQEQRSPLRSGEKTRNEPSRFHTAVLDVDDGFLADGAQLIKEQRAAVFGEECHAERRERRPGKGGYHSQVIELDEEANAEDDALLAEQRRMIFGDIHPTSKRPNKDAPHSYHSQVLELEQQLVQLADQADTCGTSQRLKALTGPKGRK